MNDTERRKLYFGLLTELDDMAMTALKELLSKEQLSDMENYITHVLNTILENNRVLAYSLTRNFNMIAGTCLRNLLENWANLASVLRKQSKKHERATAITRTAFQYELLSRYTHTDMWAAINDQIVGKERFWTSLLGWGLEFSTEALKFVDTEYELVPLRNKIEELERKISAAFAS